MALHLPEVKLAAQNMWFSVHSRGFFKHFSQPKIATFGTLNIDSYVKKGVEFNGNFVSFSFSWNAHAVFWKFNILAKKKLNPNIKCFSYV